MVPTITHQQATSSELVRTCLARISARDEAVSAWAHVDPEMALARAAEADTCAPISALHGIPIGLKDIINTADMPTGYGSPAWQGFRPDEDAEAVRRLRAAGAVILGKTTTTEFATYHPTQTRNPHLRTHTPGGSSAGSAAAVADGQVPLALGTQTAGSVTRPGSFCGVFTFKPSYGRWPFAGVLPVALTFDTLGGFARDPRLFKVLDEVLTPEAAASELPPLANLRVGVLRGPWFDRAEPEAATMLANAAEILRARVAHLEELGVPAALTGLERAHAETQSLEAGFYLQGMMRGNMHQVSCQLKKEIATAHSLSADEQQAHRQVLRETVLFAQQAFAQFDLLITLAAPGEAPEGYASTGDPIFNRFASTAGLPAAGLPIGHGRQGLPLGLQLISSRHTDRSLLGLVEELTFEHRLSAIPDLPEVL